MNEDIIQDSFKYLESKITDLYGDKVRDIKIALREANLEHLLDIAVFRLGPGGRQVNLHGVEILI